MLKWTLRNPSDAPTPPPPPEARYQVRNAEVKFNLKDSNKCWLATQVKVAQVRSTSKIVEASIENGENVGEESGKFDQGKENDSIFKRWMSTSHPHAEEDKKRKRHHKHTKCNPLDPLRLFSGEVTDSDTGSVYMRLDHTPAALQPRPQVVATTGPNDPRRKPLIDISNGDYSDLRKHLQHISTSHLHHHHHHHHHPHHHHHQLPQYLQKFAPCYTHQHQHNHHEGRFQQVVDGARHPHRTRPDPLGASASQVVLNHDHRRRSRSSSTSRSRSSSVSRPRPLVAVNSGLLANSSVNSNTPITSRGVAEGQSHSMLQGCRAGNAPHAFKRHSIADIPTEASFRGVWETQKERRGRSSSHERREGSQDRSKQLRFSRDRRKEFRVEEERSCRSSRERVEGRRASREKSKDEPIYEKVGGTNTSSTSTSDSSMTSKKSKATSGSSLTTSRKSNNSYENAVYMSMRDLRAQCPQDDMRELSEYDGEHTYSSLHIRISPDPNKTPVQMRDHLYENMLYLPMTEIKSALKKPQDRSRPLLEPPNFDDPDLDDTCDFTSEPQKDIHKPVAIKISNELIARFGKSPNDRQHPMPHYGLYIASQPSKKPCAVEDGQDVGPHRVPSEVKQTKVYKSTGQHVHIDYSEKQSEPSIPLHNLRPPPPPPPRKFRSSQGSSGPRVRNKPKGQTKPKSDSHLPVIYENTRQGEDLTQSAKKRKLRHTMEIEFSFEDDDIPINRSSEDASAAGTSPRGGTISSSDNPDSGVSEGITTPLISPLSAPRSPQTPRSDSLLEEPCTPLSLEELHAIKENEEQKFIRENDCGRNLTVFSNMSHDITDPRFLESPFKNGPFTQKSYAGQPSFGNEGFSDDTFHHLNTLYLQQTNSSISYSNVGTLCHSQLEYIDTLSNKSNDVSKMLLSAVGRNLFHDSTNKISTPHRDLVPGSSLSRRHSFAGLADISRRLSSIGFSDDTSLWGMEVSDHNESTLKKAKSLNCLSPAATLSPRSKNVPLTESMAEILRDPESRPDSRGCSRLTDSSERTSPDASEQSVQWWVVGEEDRRGRTTKGSGRVGGLAGQPGPLSDSPASHHHLPLQPGPAKHTPTLLLLRSPTSNPTPMLPVEMSGGQHLAAGHAGASFHSVPLGPSSCEDSARPDVSQCVSDCGVESTLLPSGEGDSLTARQKRRQEESSYRLQRMLQDCTTPLLENEADDSVSADWSMEAILDEVSTLDHQDLDTISDPLDSPESPDSQDIISVCTLDSEYGDNIYLSPKLCEKIKQVSEDRMLARLRKSFRSKKEKRSVNSNPTTTAPPKVGILMFVDNPMYLSPEVKKEAKIVSAQTKSENSVWYVGNPMYNSPETDKLRDTNYEMRQKVICEKENLRNTRLAKVVCQNIDNRKPLANIWLQSNPCYESPDVKKPEVKKTNVKTLPGMVENTYLTPIPVQHPKNFVVRPTIVPSTRLADDKDILDPQKFLDHEYCTIPGDESDSWVSQSTSSKRSDSPGARRSLEFGLSKGKKGAKATKASTTPSRIWRHTGKNQHSTPQKYQDTLEKNLDSRAPLGTRAYRTPRSVKRSKKTKDISQGDVRNASSPPPLPARPHPLHHLYRNDTSNSTIGFEDTNDFHRRGLEDIQDLHRQDLDDSSKFQLPPDSVYESISSIQEHRYRGLARSSSHASTVSHRRHHDLAYVRGSTSVRSSPVPSSRVCHSQYCYSRAKNGLGGSLSEGSQKARSRKTSTAKRVTKKYRARDVLQGKGQLKLAVYENFGLLTIHIMEARKLRSRLSSVCNPYVKISLVPDREERTFCRTPLVRATNSPDFDQKFSFDFLSEDLEKRLLVSVWNRDILRRRSEFLGCMSFSVAHITTRRVHGWFRLLTETLGRRKHFAVSFLNASHETTRTAMEEVLILDDDPPAPSTSVAPSDAEGVTGSKHLPPGQTPYTISITVVRGNQGFGFSVAWTKPPRVERVEEGLPADQAGLRPGDYIIFVSHYNVVKFDEDSVLDIIRECGDKLPLEVYRRGVSKHPRGLPNGYTARTTLTENESHPRKRLSHISFNTESSSADRQTIIFALINCEQAFSHACRFGLERYLIPLKFRSDLITQSQHRALFNNMDQLMDLSENLVDRLMGSDEDTIGDHVGNVYYHLIEELAEHYDNCLGGLPEADKVLSLKLLDMDFKDFLLVPTVPRKKPDITTFIHKPAEHLREVLGLLTQVYTSSPGHPDNTYLDTVLHRLKSCYRGMTSQQNIMEPSPPAHLPTGLFGITPSPSSIRSSTPLRPPLVSVSDIEQRLVFTKFTQPFRLNDTWRQWVFGGELYKFEGRHLKQYWAMLFTDLLLFTKINRDRVIFVMEDPVPITGVCQALFNIKKKATEFRLIVDTTVRVSGAGSGYLTTSKSQRVANKNSVSGRSHKKTMVLRAPSIDLKATWNNLIHRQLYICQQQQQQQQQQLAGSPRHHAPSLARAVSSDGLHSLPLATGRFSSSVGDLRRGGRQEEEEIVLDLGNDRVRGSTSSLFRSSKVKLRPSGECEEEIDLNLENEPVQAPPYAPATSAAPVATAPRVNHRRTVAPPADLQAGELHLVIQDEDPARSSSRRVRSSRPSKVRRGGKALEEIVLNLDDDEVQTVPAPQNARSSRVNSALVNGSQEPPADVVIDQNVDNAAKDSTDNGYDEEVEDDIVIQDERTGIQTRVDSKKGKGIGGKVKDKLFPNRHLPKKKKMNRVKKVEKFVDSIVVEDLNHHGRVTPVFVDEEDLTPDDFAQKRIHILQNRPRNYIEGEEEVISLDVSSPSTSHLSPMRAELMMAEERRKIAQKKKEEKRIAMRLEGIEEESLERSSSLGHEEPQKTVLSPEDYEDYIGDAVEKDYPELAGGSEAPPPQRLDSQEEELPSEQCQQLEQEQLIENQKQLIEEQKQVIEMQKQLIEEKEQQDQVQPPQPTGPLSGSASMNFMDDHSPTSNGNGDYFHRCVAKYPRDPPRQACGSFSVEANYLLTSEVDIRNETCRSIPENSLLNNNESINSFSTHFRTSCVASNDYVSGSRKPKRTTSVSSSTSASVTESRNNSTSASEHSSMSISTGSVSSNLSNANKNRSGLFLPTSTKSLPEISIEPPTPQAPKPNDSFDRENKIIYDLRVPGYRSMFLTVPGFDDDDCDRYLPKYDLDSDDEEHSSDDDDIVHKPRVFASLAGTAESRGLKRYGSSCDIAKLVNSTAEPIYYPHDDDPNGNFEFGVRKSKIGGTGSGPFVARKLEMFEKVVEEEHQKFIECQEVRKRIFRAPKKSGEYIEKFYSPQVIETIDVRATEKSRSLRYYDDEYDSFDNPRSPTPTELKTPYGGHSSPQMAPSNYSSRPSCSSLYSGTIYDPPRSPSPARDYPVASYADDVFDTYDFVGGHHPRSPTPPTDSRKDVRVCSPIPEMTVDNEVIYSQPTMFKDANCSETTVSGPSRSSLPNIKDNLEQRTDEVLEMLDNSFLDTLPEDDGPNHYATQSMRHDENAEEGAVAGYNVGNSVYDAPEDPPRVFSPLPELCVTPDPDALDDVFDIEDYDSQGSTTSLKGGHRRRAAPPPPPPAEEAGPSSSSSSSDKRGGFFGRVRRERDKDKDKDKKDKEKKDKEKEKKEKKEKEKEKKEKEKREKENKDKDKDKAAGKRFQLFGGAKKASEPNAAEETSTKPPKKDKGKRRLFSRGKENFIGCSAHISHESDPQVARMAGDSFDQESIDLQEDSEFL